jgi:hypothetical protein
MSRQLAPLLAALLFATLLNARPAAAIPVYARQLGVDCTQCHTVWPRLNAFGRQFKIKGYVDTSPLGDRQFPFAVRLKTDFESATSSAPGTPASTSRQINFPDELMLFTGGAITSRLGAFIQVTGSRDGSSFPVVLDTARLAYNTSQLHPASITFFKDGIFGADPYPSLGGTNFSPFSTDAASPLFLQNGLLLAPLDGDNYGLVYHGYLDRNNHIYGAAGLETGGPLPDTLAGSNRVSNESLKYYTRLAYENTLGTSGGIYNLGACYFTGKVDVLPPAASIGSYAGHVSRLFVDGAIQLPLRQHDYFELVGLYGAGVDSKVREFNPPAPSSPFSGQIGGLFLQSDYYFNRKWGPQLFYDSSTVGNTTFKTLGVGLAWLPQRDFKIGLSALNTSASDHSKSSLFGFYLTKYFYVPIQALKDQKE